MMKSETHRSHKVAVKVMTLTANIPKGAEVLK